MKHNNILRLAIASALSIGVNTSYAAQLDIYHFDQVGNTVVNGAPTFASELFIGSNPTVPDGTDGGNGKDDLWSPSFFTGTNPNDQYIFSEYHLNPSLVVGTQFQVKFELTQATFGQNIDLNPPSDFLVNPAVTTISISAKLPLLISGTVQIPVTSS